MEDAYLEQYGESIPIVTASGLSSPHALWKMHGDVNRPEEPWVLPFEDGRLSEELLTEVNSKVTGAIIIGYSESEPFVKEKLIGPLIDRGSVTRIGPSHPHDPPNSFTNNATDAMKKLSEGFRTAANAR